MDSTNWLILSGALTLATWLAAGLLAVFDTHREIFRHQATRPLRYLTSGFTIGGLVSTLALLTLMVLE